MRNFFQDIKDKLEANLMVAKKLVLREGRAVISKYSSIKKYKEVVKAKGKSQPCKKPPHGI